MNHTDYIQTALSALEFSYSPYSHFRVGACLVCEDGSVYRGANFENASYGATICAERCAVANALMDGKRRYCRIYIACDKGTAWPCGICRQVLSEFKAGDMEVWTGSKDTPWQMMKLSELLPKDFGPGNLGL